MKTQEQIQQHIKDIENEDFFGFQSSDLVDFLDYDHAKEYLTEEATKENWEWQEPTKENVLKEIKDYMEFAWDKANNCRGLSADRNIQHMLAWTWLMDDGFYEEVKKEYDSNYEYYGKNILKMICDKYGIDSKQYDDGIRVNSESEL